MFATQDSTNVEMPSSVPEPSLLAPGFNPYKGRAEKRVQGLRSLFRSHFHAFKHLALNAGGVLPAEICLR